MRKCYEVIIRNTVKKSTHNLICGSLKSAYRIAKKETSNKSGELLIKTQKQFNDAMKAEKCASVGQVNAYTVSISVIERALF